MTQQTKIEKFDTFVAERSASLRQSNDPRLSSVRRTAIVGGIGIAVSTLLFGRSLLRGGDWLITSGLIGGGSFALVGLGVWLHRSPSNSVATANTEAKKKVREIAKNPAQKQILINSAKALYTPAIPLLSRYTNDLDREPDLQILLDTQQAQKGLHRQLLKSTALIIPLLLFSVAAIASKQRLLVAGGVTAIWGTVFGTALYGLVVGLESMRHRIEERRAQKELNYLAAYKMRRNGVAVGVEMGAHITRLNLSNKRTLHTTLAPLDSQNMRLVLQRCPKLKQLKVNGAQLTRDDLNLRDHSHLVHLVVKEGAAELIDRLPSGIKRATLPQIEQEVDVVRYRRLKVLKAGQVSEEGLKTIQQLRKLQRLTIRECDLPVQLSQLSEVLEVLEVPRLAPVANPQQIAGSKLRKVVVERADIPAIRALVQAPRLRQATLKRLPGYDPNIASELDKLFDLTQRKSPELEEVSLNRASLFSPALFEKLSPQIFHVFVIENDGKEKRLDAIADFQAVYNEDLAGTPRRIIVRKPSGDLTKALGG